MPLIEKICADLEALMNAVKALHSLYFVMVLTTLGNNQDFLYVTHDLFHLWVMLHITYTLSIVPHHSLETLGLFSIVWKLRSLAILQIAPFQIVLIFTHQMFNNNMNKKAILSN